MPVIALTGATGFVGTALIPALSAHPDVQLRLLVRNAGRRHVPGFWGRCTVIDGDLNNRDALAKLAQGADHVVHAAASISGNSAADFDRTNITGTRNLVDACGDSSDASGNAPHLILLSSLAAREPNLSWYASSKRAAEEVVCTAHEAFSILRPPAVYGPQDPALADFWRQLAHGRLIRLGPNKQRFSLLHVDDLAAAIARAIAKGPTGDTFELAGNQPDGGWSWTTLAECAQQQLDKPVRTIAVPGLLLKSVAALAPHSAKLTGKSAMLSPGKARELRHHDWVCDNQRITEALEWTPGMALKDALTTLPGWNDR